MYNTLISPGQLKIGSFSQEEIRPHVNTMGELLERKYLDVNTSGNKVVTFNLKSPGYDVYRNDPTNSEGTVILVKNKIGDHHIPTPDDLRSIEVTTIITRIYKYHRPTLDLNPYCTINNY